MRELEKEVAAVLIQSDDRQFVLGRKMPKNNGPYSGLWVFPGGVIKDSEAPIEGAQREVLSEVGLNIAEYPTELIDDDDTDESEVCLLSGERIIYRMRFHRFHTQIGKLAEEVMLTPSVELPIVKWVPEKFMTSYEQPSPSIRLLAKVGIQ